MRFKANSCRCLGQRCIDIEHNKWQQQWYHGRCVQIDTRAYPLHCCSLKPHCLLQRWISWPTVWILMECACLWQVQKSNPRASITQFISLVCFISSRPVSGLRSNVIPRNPAVSSSYSRLTPNSHKYIAELLISIVSLLQKMMSSTWTTHVTLVPTKRQRLNLDCSNPQALSFWQYISKNLEGSDKVHIGYCSVREPSWFHLCTLREAQRHFNINICTWFKFSMKESTGNIALLWSQSY